jgi:hypothetical protein
MGVVLPPRRRNEESNMLNLLGLLNGYQLLVNRNCAHLLN